VAPQDAAQITPGLKCMSVRRALSGGRGCLAPWEGSYRIYASKESRVSAACSGPFALPQGEKEDAWRCQTSCKFIRIHSVKENLACQCTQDPVLPLAENSLEAACHLRDLVVHTW